MTCVRYESAARDAAQALMGKDRVISEESKLHDLNPKD